MSELKALCGRTATEEGDGVPQQVLSSKPSQQCLIHHGESVLCIHIYSYLAITSPQSASVVSICALSIRANVYCVAAVVSVLVRAVFEETQDSTAAPCGRLSQVCRSVLDDMLSCEFECPLSLQLETAFNRQRLYLIQLLILISEPVLFLGVLDTLDSKQTLQSGETAAE